MHESALLSHVIDVVRAAPLRKDPFAHIYFEHVLPEAFYAELLQALPEASRFEPLYHKDALRPDGTTTRSTFTLAPEELAALPEGSRRTLETCAAAIGSRELREALLARYEDVLRERFPTRYKDLALEGTVKLQRDEPGYKIGIHPDTSDKVVLLQLYLAPDDAHAEMGTALYRRQGQEFVKADTLAFRRNSGYSFARTEESWHGVEPVGALRYSLTLNYRLESQKLRRTFKKRVLRQLKRFVQTARGRAS
jgi:hypothetical protein